MTTRSTGKKADTSILDEVFDEICKNYLAVGLLEAVALRMELHSVDREPGVLHRTDLCCRASCEVSEPRGERLDLLLMGLVDANRTGKAPAESVTPQDLRGAGARRGVSRPHPPRPEPATAGLPAGAY